MHSSKLLFFMNAGQIFAVFLFARTGHFHLAFTAYLVIHTVRIVNSPINSALIVRNVHANIRSTVISSEGQMNSIGQIVGGPIVGWIASTASVATGIFSTGMILLPTAFLYLILMKYHRDSERTIFRLEHD